MQGYYKTKLEAVVYICRKIWGGQGHSGQAIKLEADRNSFSFSAPKMGYLDSLGFFPSSGESEFSFLFYISVSFQKCHLHWAENVMFATEP